MGWHIGVWTQQRTFGSGDCPVASTDMRLDGQTQPEPPVRYHQKPVAIICKRQMGRKPIAKPVDSRARVEPSRRDYDHGDCGFR